MDIVQCRAATSHSSAAVFWPGIFVSGESRGENLDRLWKTGPSVFQRVCVARRKEKRRDIASRRYLILNMRVSAKVKVYGHFHREVYGLAIQHRRLIFPLLHGRERRFDQQVRAAHCVLTDHVSVCIDHGVDHHRA